MEPASRPPTPPASTRRRFVTILMVALFVASGYSLFFKRTLRRALHRLFGQSRHAPYSGEALARALQEALQPRRSAYLDFAFHAVAFVVSACYLAVTLVGQWRRSAGRPAD